MDRRAMNRALSDLVTACRPDWNPQVVRANVDKLTEAPFGQVMASAGWAITNSPTPGGISGPNPTVPPIPKPKPGPPARDHASWAERARAEARKGQ